jgi:hypothetical protein
LVTQLGGKLETMSDVELRAWLEERGRRFAPFRSFVISNEEPLRKIAASTGELKWMLRYIDFSSLIRTGYVYRNGEEHLLTDMGREALAQPGVYPRVDAPPAPEAAN